MLFGEGFSTQSHPWCDAGHQETKSRGQAESNRRGYGSTLIQNDPIHTYSYACAYTHAPTYTNIYIRIQTYTNIYVHAHTYTWIYIHMYIHLHMHICIYTYICMCMYCCCCCCCCGSYCCCCCCASSPPCSTDRSETSHQRSGIIMHGLPHM